MFGIRKLLPVLAGTLVTAAAASAVACPPQVRSVSRAYSVVHVQPIETIVVPRVEAPVVARRVAVQPIAPATSPAPAPAKLVPVGAKLALKLPFPGIAQGAVRVRIEGVALGAKVEEWGPSHVTFRLPADLNPVEKDELPAVIEAYSAEGRLLKTIAVVIAASPELGLVADAPTTAAAPALTPDIR